MKKLTLWIVFLLCISMTPVLAEEAPSEEPAESVSETAEESPAEEPQAPAEEAQGAPEETPAEEAPAFDENDPVGKVSAMIYRIDAENPQAALVLQARTAYDALSKAQQMKVEGYEKLLAAEEVLGAGSDEPEEKAADKDNKKEGSDYTIEVSSPSDLPITLSIRFPEMDNNIISLTSPEEETFELDTTQSIVRRDDITLRVEKAEPLYQLTITKAENGFWTIGTNKSVVFNRMQNIPTEQDSSKEPEAPQEENEEENSEESSVDVAKIGAVALVFVALIVAAVLAMKAVGKKKEEPAAPEVPTKEEEESDEELLRKIREEMKAQFKDEPEEKPVKQKDRYENDSRLMETQRVKTYSEEDIKKLSGIREIGGQDDDRNEMESPRFD